MTGVNARPFPPGTRVAGFAKHGAASPASKLSHGCIHVSPRSLDAQYRSPYQSCKTTSAVPGSVPDSSVGPWIISGVARSADDPRSAEVSELNVFPPSALCKSSRARVNMNARVR